jgi:hypothetical protein
MWTKPKWLCKEMKYIKKYQKKTGREFIHGTTMFDEVKIDINGEIADIWLKDKHTFFRVDSNNTDCDESLRTDVEEVKMHQYKSKETKEIYVGYASTRNGDLYLTEYNEDYVMFVDFETSEIFYHLKGQELQKEKELLFKLGKKKYKAIKDLENALGV